MSSVFKEASLSQVLARIAIIIGFTAFCACIAVVVVNLVIGRVVTHAAAGIGSPDPEKPRKLDAVDSVFIEELTWMEVRDAMKAGKDTVIIATGGVEQGGDYLAMGKHNYVLRATTEAIARKLGNALVAPIIAFVPEGNIDPPTDHMKYAGTISLTEDTYRALLKDICECYRVHGFKHIILFGDSYDNLTGMEAVAEDYNRHWKDGKTKAHYIHEYYNYNEVGDWLEANGVNQIPEWIHDDFATTAMIMTVDPTKVRMEQRIKAGNFRINTVELSPAANTIAWGKKIVDFRADLTVKAIRKATNPESSDSRAAASAQH
jgi:creatinine amidohydrolase